jgi:hypothetical protein
VGCGSWAGAGSMAAGAAFLPYPLSAGPATGSGHARLASSSCWSSIAGLPPVRAWELRDIEQATNGQAVEAAGRPRPSGAVSGPGARAAAAWPRPEPPAGGPGVAAGLGGAGDRSASCAARLRSSLPPPSSLSRDTRPTAEGNPLPVARTQGWAPSPAVSIGMCIGVQINPESDAGPILTRDCSPHSGSTVCISRIARGADR